MTVQTCATCKHWHKESEYDDEEDALGSCEAIADLPYAFRYAWREVMWTRANEPPESDPCNFHQPKG